MAALYNLQQLIVGGFADFIEHGTTVDTNTTSSTAQPDDDPITNWTDANLGCVQNVNFETETNSTETYCAREAGGYIKEVEHSVVADYIKLTLSKHSEPIYRLLFGLKNKLTGATGQKAFENSGDREITGWLRLRGVGPNGEALVVAKIEVKMRLENYPGWSKDATFPEVKLEVINNTLNDLTDSNVLVA